MTAALQDPAQTDTARSIFALLMRDHPSSQEQGKNQPQSLRRTLGRLSGDRPKPGSLWQLPGLSQLRLPGFCRAKASSEGSENFRDVHWHRMYHMRQGNDRKRLIGRRL